MKKRKTSKQKGVLAVSMLLAGVIVAGGTFAWFTSEDEVVNQLSASNNYGVSITESFTPPSGWVPGQEVEKAVGAVNTGNIDAFVRLGVSNTLDLTKLSSADTAPSGNADNYVKLKTDTDADEVTAIQAGGVLAGAWKYDTASGAWVEITDSGKSIVGTVGTGFNASESGLYIFRRSLKDADGTRSFEYKGYYYDASALKYYALASIPKEDSAGTSIIDSDGYFSGVPAVTYQTTEKTTVTPTLKYVAATDSAAAYIQATYDPDNTAVGDTDADTDNNIIINIKLTKFADGQGTDDTWTADGVKLEFYYNKLLAAGATSDNLIAAVELDPGVKSDAYYSFDYNLAIKLDSVQASPDDDKTTAVNAQSDWWKASVTDNGAFTWKK